MNTFHDRLLAEANKEISRNMGHIPVQLSFLPDGVFRSIEAGFNELLVARLVPLRFVPELAHRTPMQQALMELNGQVAVPLGGQISTCSILERLICATETECSLKCTHITIGAYKTGLDAWLVTAIFALNGFPGAAVDRNVPKLLLTVVRPPDDASHSETEPDTSWAKAPTWLQRLPAPLIDDPANVDLLDTQLRQLGLQRWSWPPAAKQGNLFPFSFIWAQWSDLGGEPNSKAMTHAIVF
jgi:hypothetical protein